jgi:hypothetical protein
VINRRRLSLILTVGAALLAATFIDYRVQPIHVCSGSFDMICPASDEIVSLGLTTVDPSPGSMVAQYHGKNVAERGLYSRYKIPIAISIVGGVLLPFLMLVTAVILRPRRNTLASPT